MEDFEAPIDDATESAVDPFGGYEPPQEESYAPPQSYTPPPQPPVPQDYDDTPEWLYDENLDLQSYTKHVIEEGWNRFRQTLGEEKLQNAVARAREAHDGRDGLPAHDELVNGYALPLLAQHPDLHRLVLRQADPAAASYLIGFMAKYPELRPQVLARNGRIDRSIFQPVNFRPTVRGQSSGARRQPGGRFTASDWKNMPVNDFERELHAFKMSSEGE
jgi:hypothetical protein